ncbi:unnamed protein product [Rotaria sordida]|uniref:Uncharacterized protein n=1 Tax=Rotaria sordida TaxID=392033 RepID=A0A818SVU5_9BILA|nr:unnamed protein product [Rotaria sordida]
MLSIFLSSNNDNNFNTTDLLYFLCKENEIGKIRNNLSCIDNIKQRRLFSKNDYDYIEWPMVGNDLLGKRHKFCEATDLYKTYDNHHLVSKLLAEVIHYCLNEYLLNQSNNTENLEYQTTRKQIEIIQGCFREDIEKQDDLTYFIKAYSRTTCFYKELNKHLAFYILEYFDKTKHFSSNYRLFDSKTPISVETKLEKCEDPNNNKLEYSEISRTLSFSLSREDIKDVEEYQK